MGKINFKPGEFITHLTMPNSFAIYGGEELPPQEGDDPKYKDYTLICYYNANQKRGPVVSKPIFDADIDNKLCQYVLSEKDSFWWRRCNSDEKYKALKILAEQYQIAWEEKEQKLRRLASNEKLVLDDKETPKRGERKRNENVVGRVPLIGGTQPRGTETTLRPPKKCYVLRYPSSQYKQAKKISGHNNSMIEHLVTGIDAVNKRDSMANAYTCSPYYGNNCMMRQPYYNGMYDEFWGD